MTGSKLPSMPVVCADRFYLSEKAGEALASLGGYAWADAADAGDLGDKIGGSPSVKVLVSEYVPINDAVLDRAPGLLGVIAYGAGYNHIDVKALGRRGVQACNCPGENSQAVAELTFGLLLSLLRKIRRADPWVRSGGWEQAGLSLPDWAVGGELWGKTLGVVGLGQIGKRVVKIAHGFGMNVLGFDPSLDAGHLSLLGAEPAALPELLGCADIVTLHVPLAPGTLNLINAQALASVKPGMVLVNTSRGKVVDEEAFLEALRSGRISGAALDVFADEPLRANHPLASMENVVLTPHIGALTREAGERLSDSVARQAKAILEGHTPEGLIRLP